MATSTTPVVTLAETASLKGDTSSIKDSSKPVHSFLGIPYAEPPVGDLRFKPPKPAVLWEGERLATEFGAIGLQAPGLKDMLATLPLKYVDTESEDCLFLNVWTPTLDPKAKLPVMFWSHGGAFIGGCGDHYQGNALCSFHDVVVVTINYRLGPFGFLCLDDENVPGNCGILDQIEALRWVNKYICKFGGDPCNVTLFGESAGAVSIHLMTLTDLTKGLFRRIILQSGTALLPGHVLTPSVAFESIADSLKSYGFTSTSKKSILKFLQSLPAQQLNILKGNFRPVIDNILLKNNPLDLLKDKELQNVDCILGYNSHEGWIATSAMAAAFKIDINSMNRSDAEKLVTAGIDRYTLPMTKDKILPLLMENYIPEASSMESEDIAAAVCDLFTDLVFSAAADTVARIYSEAGMNCFLYYFEYRPSYFKGPHWVKLSHIPDIFYVFGSPFHPGLVTADFNDEEKEVSQMIMNYWVQFATNGLVETGKYPNWQKYTTDREDCMIFKAKPKMEKLPTADRLILWRKIHNNTL